MAFISEIQALDGTIYDIKAKEVPTDVVKSESITKMVKLTQAEYDELAEKDANTFYIIVG